MFRALDTLGTRDQGRGTSAATSPPVPLPSSPGPRDMLIRGTTIATSARLERVRRGSVAEGDEVLPLFRGFERSSATSVEACLRPRVSSYIEGVEGGLRGREIGARRVMTSGGGARGGGGAAAHAASLALSG